MARIKVIESVLGSVKVEDGSEIGLRVAIGGLNEIGNTPAGVFVIAVPQIIITVDAPQEMKNKVARKPLINPTEDVKLLDKWQLVKISNRESAYEKVEYLGSDERTYVVKMEITPNIVSRTLEFRDQFSNPAYYVRWNECTTTSFKE